MAITVLKARSLGDQVTGVSEVRGSIAGPVSYATGGFAADIVTDLGVALTDMDFVQVTATGGYIADFDAINGKIIAYDSAATETTATTDLSTISFHICVKVKATSA